MFKCYKFKSTKTKLKKYFFKAIENFSFFLKKI